MQKPNLVPVLNNSGNAVFAARADNFFDDETPRGFYFADGTETGTFVRENGPVPDGAEPINLGETIYRANDAGQVAFVTAADHRLYRAGPDELVEIARLGEAPPDGNGEFAFLYTADVNDSGQVAFQADVWDPVDEAFELAIYYGDEHGLTKIIRRGDSAPGMSAPPTSFENPSLNDSGQVVFAARSFESGERAVYFASGGTLTPVALTGPAPGGGTFTNFGTPSINAEGHVAFDASIDSGLEQGIYKWEGAELSEIVRTGTSAPAENGILDRIDVITELNDIGQVAFAGQVAVDDFSYYALFRSHASGVAELARGGQTVPNGNGTFTVSEDTFFNITLNNEGHVAFSIGIENTTGGAADNFGIFLHDGTNILQVARTGGQLEGSTVTALAFNEFGAFGRPLNDNMQLAYRATLADGREIVARFEPNVYWRNPGDGAWATPANWSLGIEPIDPYDVFIIAEEPLTVSGPTVDRTVKSLTIGGEEMSAAMLNLVAGTTLTATNGTTIHPNGILAGEGTLAGDLANLAGIVSPGSSPGIMHVDGDFVQDDLGMLVLEIFGSLEGTDYDVLDISGSVVLNGDVVLAFIDGYFPPLGTQFNLIAFGGDFDASKARFHVLGAPAGLQLTAFTQDGVFGLRTAAVPEPGAAALIVAASMLGVLCRGRPRPTCAPVAATLDLQQC